MAGSISYANPRGSRATNSLIQQAASRLGITEDEFLEREKMLGDKEDQDRLDAMDPNKSKFMSEEEKQKKLNAYNFRRFKEYGIGHIPGEGQIVF